MCDFGGVSHQFQQNTALTLTKENTMTSIQLLSFLVFAAVG